VFADTPDSIPHKETGDLPDFLRYGSNITASGLLLLGFYYFGKHFQEIRKESKDNENLLEAKNDASIKENANLQREHVAMLEKQNDKLLQIIRESHSHAEKMLQKYHEESEKQRIFFSNEYDKQRAFYEKMYTELKLEYNKAK
jgi:membrane glycosyltransferase